MYNYPCLWLRLAECCIIHYLKVEKKEKKSKFASNDNLNPDIVFHEIISGRKGGTISLECEEITEKKIFNNNHNNKAEINLSNPHLSLPYGVICLRNLLRIVNLMIISTKEERDKLIEAEKTKTSSKSKGNNWIKIQEVKLFELEFLELIALIHLSWVSLQLSDPINAMHSAKKATELIKTLKSPNTSILAKYEHLATLYLVEAYFELSKFNDAISVLSKYLEKTDFSNEELEFSQQGWEIKQSTGQEKKVKNLKCSMYCNLAIIHLKRRDTVLAQKYISQAEVIGSNFHPIILLKLYMSLVEGKVNTTIQILSDPSLPPLSTLKFRGKFNRS